MSEEVISEFEVGMRLDKALAVNYPQYSRSALEKLITSGNVLVNGKEVATKYKLKAKDEVSVDLTLFQQPAPIIQLPILYEDEDVVVINKPAGVLTHAKGTLHNEATVATWLRAHISEPSRTVPESGTVLDEGFWSTNRAGIVHRLDRGTSGVMICAKNEASRTHLQKQFERRNVKKVYYALVSNKLPEKEGIIDLPIERNPKKPASFRAGINGKQAQTHFKVVKVIPSEVEGSTDDNPDLSIPLRPTQDDTTRRFLVELKPETGRTHQLRVHLAYLRAPIVGDDLYGGEASSRLMLHAHTLEITLPNSKRKIFTAPLPLEFEKADA